ncbi:MAG TPA: hypothetical protein EYQ31_09355, partial [Candidatus Handelsmanbacteria bacterium]|nr:hypothetical protein [Candidatus Handelsmanbacteria bacterium]
MSDIKKWKTPAASNVGSGFTPPDGFPEGMLRSDLNNSMREVQASMRRLWDTPDWKDPVDGFDVVQGSDDTKVAIKDTDATGYFLANPKVRVRTPDVNDYGYAFVASVAMAGSDTEVTLEDFDTTGTPTPSTSVPASCNGIDIYFLGGGDVNNHGIGRSAFSSGQSVGFEIPASDDAAGINAAIVAASSNGKTVLLPNTVVTLDASLVITSSTDNVRIVGMGGGAVKSQLQMGSGLNLPVFDIGDGSSRITLENFYINGDCTNQTTGGDGIRFGDNVQNVRIRDLWIVNCWGNGISFSGTDTGGGEHYAYIWIESTDIHRCGNTGIYITDPNGTNDRIFISDVAISQFGDTGDAATSGAQACGIDLAGRAQIEGVVVWPTTLSPHASFAGAAIRLHESGGSGSPPGGRQCQVSNFRIAGNMVGVTGLHLRGADCQVSNGLIDLSG